MQIKNRSTVAGIFFGYFIMGLVDIVGISANYVKADFSLSDSVSSFLPLIAFISFAFLAVPSGMLMNRIGRKNSVLASFIRSGRRIVCDRKDCAVFQNKIFIAV